MTLLLSAANSRPSCLKRRMSLGYSRMVPVALTQLYTAACEVMQDVSSKKVAPYSLEFTWHLLPWPRCQQQPSRG